MESIKFIIPEGYVKSDKSTDKELIFVRENKIDVKQYLFNEFNGMCVKVYKHTPKTVYYIKPSFGAIFSLNPNNLFVSNKFIAYIENTYKLSIVEVKELIRSTVKEVFNWEFPIVIAIIK